MFAIFIGQTPFFRFLLPFIAGVVTAHYFPVSANWWLPACAVMFCLLCAVQRRKRQWMQYRGEWLFGVLAHVFLFVAGACAISASPFVPNEQTEQGTYVAVVEDPPVEREKSIRMTVGVKARKTDGAWENRREKVMMYVGKDPAAMKIRQGDLLVMDAALRPVTSAGNPYEFDYRSYLAGQHIGRTAYVENGKWKILDHYAQGPLENLANRIRYFLLDIFAKAKLDGNELAVASALTLGYKAYLNDELKTAYSISGAMHVLAVSGLHVGILYFIVNFLLGRIGFLQSRKGWRAVLILSILWLYALVTGMSPSVRRATLMFSIIVAGTALRRKSYIYNSIATSAFLILSVNPHLLFNIGFQLSYAAVLAIVFFHPRLYALCRFKNRFADAMWSLACVSIAVQIGSEPVLFYYFHMFTSYFLLTNFIVIPAASVIMYGALLLFAVSPAAWLLEWTGWLLDKFIYLVNACVFFIEKLPGSMIDGIRFHGWELLLVYPLIAAVCAWIILHRKVYLWLSLCLLGIWTGGSVVRDYHDLSRKRLIVYHSRGNTLLQLIHGRRDEIWYDSRNAAFDPAYFTYDQRVAMKLENTLYAPLHEVFSRPPGRSLLPEMYAAENFFRFAGKRIAVFDPDHPPPPEAANTLDVDVAVLTRNVPTDIKNVVRFCSPEIIVVDASSAAKKITQWEEECARANVKCHNTNRNGAFILDAD
ncbi:MAG: competence protein ComEC family protein [Bacteroidales bacterium]|nr:competence protein ComEC family protein [Bacteroidales bacterium]